MIGIIPAAGQGLRLGINNPKALILLRNRELIKYLLDLMKPLRIKKVIIIEHDKAISNVLEYPDLDISYVQQNERKGIAHAIYLTKELVGKENMFIALGDEILLNDDLREMKRMFILGDFLDGICAYKLDKSRIKTAYGLKTKGNRILEVIEKPQDLTSLGNRCGIGFYMFTPYLFDCIEKTPVSSLRGEIELTDASNLVCKTSKVYSYKIKGSEVNINTKEDLEYANSLMRPSD